jgi:hypothetical protein
MGNMRKLFSIISLLSTIFGAIALLGADTLSMLAPETIPVEWQRWGLFLFIIGVGLPTVINQLENFSTSKIHLFRYGIQPDKAIYVPVVEKIMWWKKEYAQRIEFPAFWIEIENLAGWGLKSIEGIFPRISWYDSSGKLINRNNGRWWLSNVSEYTNTALLQTVNLDPNGQTQLLHFARFINGKLHIWHRTQDNKEPFVPLPDGEYFVDIELISNSGQRTICSFSVSCLDNQLQFKMMSDFQKIKKHLIMKSKKS